MMNGQRQCTSEPEHLIAAKVLITGGTSGLGAAFAKLFARRGYSIVITGRRKQALSDMAVAISNEFGVDCQPLCSDLNSESDLEKLLSYISSNKRLTILVNNAGFNIDGQFDQLTREQHQSMLTTHIHSATLLSHAAMPNLLSNRGSLIIVSSLAAQLPTPLSPLYGPSKAYLKQLAATLSASYKPQGVGVIAVCPGFFRSDFHQKLGVDPNDVYRSKGLLKALDADQVATETLRDLSKGRAVSVSGWHFRFIYRLLSLLPARLLIAVTAKHRKSRL